MPTWVLSMEILASAATQYNLILDSLIRRIATWLAQETLQSSVVGILELTDSTCTPILRLEVTSTLWRLPQTLAYLPCEPRPQLGSQHS